MDEPTKSIGNKAGMKNVQEEYPTTEAWCKRKRHEDFPASVACVLSYATDTG